jgi:transcriptional regulator with XRE-family HTH domain
VGNRDDPETIGRRVQRLRVERGLTQKKLAEPVYTPAYGSTLEAGRVRASDGALRYIAERLGVADEEPAGDLADLCRLLGGLLRRTGRTEAALDAYRTGLGHRTAPGTTTLGPAPARPPL